MDHPRDALRGIGAMCVAIAGFITNDALIKLASEAMPLGEIIFIRGVLAGLMIGAVVVASGHRRQLTALFDRQVMLRNVGEIGGTIAYLTALFHLPIANSTTILQTVPLAVAAAGAVFLGERVGWRRWSAIVIGFIGVVIVIRPGPAGFDVYALWALVAVGFVVLRDLATARIPGAVPTILVAFSAVIASALAGLVLWPTEAWVAPDAARLLLLFVSALALLIGFSFIIISLRIGPITVSAPFRYTAVLWATAYGYLFWGDLPDLLTVLGMALIVGTGIYAFVRERRLGQGSGTTAGIGEERWEEMRPD